MQATVSIEIQMPQDVDLTDVVPDEVEGWTITTSDAVDGDIVDTITWDATGPGLVGEESVELPVAVGPLPEVESLTFPTVQTYDDGEVVRWIEPAPPGEPEPELPVPTLAITPASPDGNDRADRTTHDRCASTHGGTHGGDRRQRPRRRLRRPRSPRSLPRPPTLPPSPQTTEVSTSSTTVEAEDDDGSTVWWVVAGIIGFVVVVVVGGIA